MIHRIFLLMRKLFLDALVGSLGSTGRDIGQLRRQVPLLRIRFISLELAHVYFQ